MSTVVEYDSEAMPFSDPIAGAQRRTFVAAWQSPFEEEIWKRVTELGELHETEDGEDDDPYVVVGPAFPPDGAALLTQGLVTHNRQEQAIEWGLVFFTKPTEPPPERIIEADKKIGGWQGLSDLLRARVPAEAAVVDYRINFDLPATSWSCKVVPQSALQDDAISVLRATDITMEQVGYRFTDGPNGIKEISIVFFHDAPDGAFYRVEVNASGALTFGSESRLPFVEAVGTLLLGGIFTKAEQ